MAPLQVRTEVNDEIKELLSESVIGTPGSGMLYQHKSVEKRISQIKIPFFVELRTKFSLVGTCCFCFRETINRGKTNQSFYVRYFSFKDSYRSKRTPQSRIRSGKLREEIKTLLSGEQFHALSADKYFHYAYVDPRNARSALLCKEFGFQEVRVFGTFIFSRLKPKTTRSISIDKAGVEEVPEIKRMLLNRYSDFNMVSVDDLLSTGSYYIARDSKGVVVAGAKVSPTHWRIFRMHNITNTILLSVLSYVPLLNRLVNKDFRFLTVDGLYFIEGYEQYTEAFLSALLRKYNHYNALIPADRDSTLLNHLEKLDLGMVSKMSKQVSTSVICRFTNFSPEEVKQFKQHPAYVSALDIT